MRSLPESHLADSISSRNRLDQNKQFPFCYPLSPNAATLKGFRTLLLCRRRLSELVAQHKETVGDVSGTPIDPNVFRKTPMYDALSKRFKSLFIWPAFLATFMPRYDNQSTKPPPVEKHARYSSYFNPNKRMMITSDKLRPATRTPSCTPGNSSHTLTSKTIDNVSERPANQSEDRFKHSIEQNLTNVVQRPLFPSQNNQMNISTISTNSPSVQVFPHTSVCQPVENNNISSVAADPGANKTNTRKRSANKDDPQESSPKLSYQTPTKQRKKNNDGETGVDTSPKTPSSSHRRKSNSKPRKTIVSKKSDGILSEVEIKVESQQEDSSTDVFIPKTNKSSDTTSSHE